MLTKGINNVSLSIFYIRSCAIWLFLQKEAFHWLDGSPLLHHIDWSKPDVHHMLPVVLQRGNFSSVLEIRNQLDSNNHKPQVLMMMVRVWAISNN